MKNVQTISVLFAAVVLSLSVHAEPKLVNPIVKGGSVASGSEVAQAAKKKFKQDDISKAANAELVVIYDKHASKLANDAIIEYKGESLYTKPAHANVNFIKADLLENQLPLIGAVVPKEKIRPGSYSEDFTNPVNKKIWLNESMNGNPFVSTALEMVNLYRLDLAYSSDYAFFQDYYGYGAFTMRHESDICKLSVSSHIAAEYYRDNIEYKNLTPDEFAKQRDSVPLSYGDRKTVVFGDKDVDGNLIEIRVQACDGLIESISQPRYVSTTLVQEATKIATVKDTKNAKKSK